MKVKFSNVKNILKALIEWVLLFFLIILIYYYSWITGGVLTTADSCSGQYINGFIDIDSLRKDCTSLSKKNLIEHVSNSDNISQERKIFLLIDINKNFK